MLVRAVCVCAKECGKRKKERHKEKRGENVWLTLRQLLLWFRVLGEKKGISFEEVDEEYL